MLIKLKLISQHASHCLLLYLAERVPLTQTLLADACVGEADYGPQREWKYQYECVVNDSPPPIGSVGGGVWVPVTARLCGGSDPLRRQLPLPCLQHC